MIPVVLRALGSVTKNFEKYKIKIKIDIHTAQKTTLLQTAKDIEKITRKLIKETE